MIDDMLWSPAGFAVFEASLLYAFENRHAPNEANKVAGKHAIADSRHRVCQGI